MTALATAPIRLVALGDQGAIRFLAPVLFVFANVVVSIVAAGTLYRFWERRVSMSAKPTLRRASSVPPT